MNNNATDQLPEEDPLDEYLALTFFDYYRRCEHILRRAGFTREAYAPWSERADWQAFARQVQDRFDPQADQTLMSAVLFLLSDPDDETMRRGRGRVSYLLEPSLPERNTAWLVEIIQEVRHKIIFGLHLTGEPACELAHVSAALYVLETLMNLDPKVTSLFGDAPRPEDGQGKRLGDAL